MEGNGGDFLHSCHGKRRISELALWATRFFFSQSFSFRGKIDATESWVFILYFCPLVEHILFLDNYEIV